MTCTGVVGARWRATVTEWGAVAPWDGTSAIDWFVAADDRWHTPQHEAATRQISVSGTPVTETRVRIPGGDAVQRVYSVADFGGMTVIEVTNESTLPIAVAFTGGGLLTRRPPTSMPPQGIDLPADAVIHPVGHGASITLARSHGAATTLPESLPSAEQVVRGWLSQTHRASRLQLPDVAMVDAVTGARCELLLNGPVGLEMDDRDPASFLLAVAELVRLGDSPAFWVPEVATHLERWARTGAQIARPGDPVMHEAAIEAAARVLYAAGEHRALDDLRRMKLPATAVGGSAAMPGDPGLVPSWVERHLATSDEHAAQLMPMSFPPAWLGIDFEAHGLAIGLASTLSFAIRWHGDRPALLWEVHGAPMPLSYDTWTTGQLSGEALWPPVATMPATLASPESQGSGASSPGEQAQPPLHGSAADRPMPDQPPPDQSFS